MRPLRPSVAIFVFTALLVAQPQPLRIRTTTLPAPVAGDYYNFQLQASGGVPPYRWAVAAGALPAGLQLDPSGLLAGTPARAGAFQFTVRLTDSAASPNSITQPLGAETKPSIVVSWNRPPRVENGGIFGAVNFANNLAKPVDLTLIIVGVNGIGKAFVLGYQHATIAPKTTVRDIPFGFTLPRGYYVVHADAYAELPDMETLLHTRMQTPSALQVP
jgi:hypothetical protein